MQSKEPELKNDGKTKLIGNLIPYGDTSTHPPTHTEHTTHKVQRIELNSHKEHDKWLKAQFSKCVSARTHKTTEERMKETEDWRQISRCCLMYAPFCPHLYLSFCECIVPCAMLFQHTLKFLLSIFVFLMLTHSHSRRLMHNNEKLCADQIRKQRSTQARQRKNRTGESARDCGNGTEWSWKWSGPLCLFALASSFGL